ncbi:PAS domain S-box protein [Leptolyngbya sp. FACHB-671]|nr:PAS domain S-box protein [Leptolyngbya sp. FACHB-671]
MIAITLLSAAGTMFSVSSAILLHGFERVEAQAMHQNLERALDALKQDFEILSTTVRDYAVWDDTYAFITNRDSDYVKLNLNQAMWESFNLHLILMARPSEQVIFSQRRDPISSNITSVSQSVQDAVVDSGILHHADGKPHSGIVLLPDGPMLIAAHSVLTSNLEGPSRGTLVMGRYLDAAEVSRLSEVTRVSLDLRQIAGSLPPDFEAARTALFNGQSNWIQPLDSDAIAGYVLIEDIQEQPTLLLRADMPRVIYQQGALSLRYLGLSLLSLGTLFGLVIWLLWRRLTANIIERDRIEQALLQEERFRKVFEDAPIGMAIANISSGQIMKVNHALCEMLGYTSAELEAKTVQEITHSDDWNQNCHLFEQLIAGAIANYQTEKRYLKQNQETLWVNLTATLIHSPQGNGCYILGMFENVTERKQTEAILRQSEAKYRNQAEQLKSTLAELQQTQAQLVQSEKISSLSQLVAGIAHEINNPVNFISGNLTHADSHIQDLLNLIRLYQKHYPQPSAEILAKTESADLNFLLEDLPKLFSSMKVGSERIHQLILSLCNFSRLNEADLKAVNIHEGIESTLMLLENRLQANDLHPAIQVVKDYGDLPLVECYAKQLNQVFMNILLNAIEALEQKWNVSEEWHLREGQPGEWQSPKIWIQTLLKGDRAIVQISDNGTGFSEQVKARLFDPFFTTKAIGEGTGLGLSVSYQVIVGNHQGQLQCCSTPGQGAEFTIQIPLQRQLPQCRTSFLSRYK